MYTCVPQPFPTSSHSPAATSGTTACIFAEHPSTTHTAAAAQLKTSSMFSIAKIQPRFLIMITHTPTLTGSSLRDPPSGYGISFSDPVYVVDPAPKSKGAKKPAGNTVKPEEAGEDFQQVRAFPASS